MQIAKRKLEDVLTQYATYDLDSVNEKLKRQIDNSPYKIIVIDDDPTGTQTINNLSVYTDWKEQSLIAGFKERNSAFFVLSNSRSFSTEKTQKVHEEIAENIVKAARETGKEFIVISRGDSTLRGHYPLETQTLKDVLEKKGQIQIDGEIIFPFLLEGGRYTCDDIHYVLRGEELIPAAQTEFAKDKTFPYTSSNLKQWIEEKTRGTYKKEDVVTISLELLRTCDYAGIESKLNRVYGFGKVIVNALDYNDVKVFVTAFLKVRKSGKQFIFRSAAALPKILAGVEDGPLLTYSEMVKINANRGGLVIVGSHVKQTSDQLERLLTLENVKAIEFNQHLVLNKWEFSSELEWVTSLCDQYIQEGKTAVVYTRRERLDLNTGNPEDELRIATKISDALTSIVRKILFMPSFIVAKGGITSSDVAIKGLGIRKAIVLGQVRPGIPVWQTDDASLFPQMPYVVFPGNVGSKEDLKKVVQILTNTEITEGDIQ